MVLKYEMRFFGGGYFRSISYWQGGNYVLQPKGHLINKTGHFLKGETISYDFEESLRRQLQLVFTKRTVWQSHTFCMQCGTDGRYDHLLFLPWFQQKSRMIFLCSSLKLSLNLNKTLKFIVHWNKVLSTTLNDGLIHLFAQPIACPMLLIDNDKWCF